MFTVTNERAKAVLQNARFFLEEIKRNLSGDT
jgi:hypothetical protein